MTAILFIAILGVVLVAGAAGATYLAARAIGRNAKKQNEMVPGVRAEVPDNWFGSHEFEPRMHRRLQAALNGIRASAKDDLSLVETVVAAEQQALHLDRQLVACSHLPARLKQPVLADLEASVEKFENIAAQVIGRTSGISIPALSGELDALAQQLDLLEQARAEIDEIDRGGSTGTA